MAETLRGVRVLDLTRVLSGPYGTMLLADMGAEVIKVEAPGVGDTTRSLGPPSVGGESAYFLALNRNKRSVALDVRTPHGRALFLDLVERSDVVVDNFRPGVMDRLGIGPRACRDRRPDVVTCSISGFGADGPYRDRPAFDLTLQAMGGGMSITGTPGGPPVRAGLPIGDLGGGVFAAMAIAAALFRRERTGVGEHIDLSLLDVQVSLLTYVAQYHLADGVVPGPVGSAHQTIVPYQALEAADGHLVVAVFGDQFWAPFCRAVGLPGLVDRYPTNAERLAGRDDLLDAVEARVRTRPVGHWLRELEVAGVPAAPVLGLDEVVRDPQVRHREMVAEVDPPHPTAGSLEVLGNPVKVGEPDRFAPPPLLGEHTDDLLREVLGCDDGHLAALRDLGVIG